MNALKGKCVICQRRFKRKSRWPLSFCSNACCTVFAQAVAEALAEALADPRNRVTKEDE